jgi:putative ABC transport system substrate-binding protein
MISRRMLLASMVVGVLAVAPAVEAQRAAKIHRIGVLVTGPPPGEHVCVLALRRGLADLGYVEGQTHVLEVRWAEGRPEDTLPAFARDLVKLGVDVVVSVTSQGLVEAKPALASVPVVMAASNYPVERGLVRGLSHPGGNITGMATFTAGMFEKRMQLLAEAVPRASRVAVLRLPGDQNDFIVRDLEQSAQQLGLKLQVIGVQKAEDFPPAFATAMRGGAQAIMTAQGPFFLQHIRQFADLALKHKLPSFSGEPTAADAGVLMSAGASIAASCHRAATFVDRILKGARPADLPLEQSTTIGLEINLKTARALGLTISPALLLRADRVIERRAFLAGAGAVAGVLGAPLTVSAQPSTKVAFVGILRLQHADDPSHEVMRQALREAGYVEGQNVRTEWRYAEGRTDRLASLATELVRLRCDAIVALGGPVIRAVREATATIPIIAAADDLVREGHVVSLARPGGNVTGVSIFGPELGLTIPPSVLARAHQVIQ